VNDLSTNQLLGYPDEARLLIVNADDFGMCHAVNEAVMQGMLDGIIRSTTLMTPCPWAPHALRLLREHPELPFGVHLTLVCDNNDNYRWGPLASRDTVSSLVDETGAFYSYDRIPELLAGARIDEVEREFRAQIELVLTAGLKPTHIDWHCLADGRREDIYELTVTLAREHGLALRVHDRSHAERCHRVGLPANDHGVLDSYHLATSGKADRYAQLLRELPAGLSEWAVHPSTGDAEAQAIEPDGWQIRRADLDFVLSTEARQLIEDEGITLLDYRALQTIWAR
jgi:predicted glycoside hydrolase/deacetylase ChbG (UPF0249 family)